LRKNSARTSLRTIVYTFESPVTLALAGRLVDSGRISAVILQRPMDLRAKLTFLRRRLARYGLLRVGDEILFQVFYAIFLKHADETLRRGHFHFDETATKGALSRSVDVFDVDSLNTASGQEVLRRLQPDLVVMASREMIRPETLAIARLGFVGCHPGILPEYRGVYAPFWAFRDGRADRIGLSVYLANAGVDTGPLIAERALAPQFGLRHFKVESERLILEGARDLVETIEKAERGALTTYVKPRAESRMFSHVGLTHYLRAVAKEARRRPAA
jgi:folate-dependent phosphoribosylglycinamide formyltransferase PurN